MPPPFEYLIVGPRNRSNSVIGTRLYLLLTNKYFNVFVYIVLILDYRYPYIPHLPNLCEDARIN